MISVHILITANYLCLFLSLCFSSVCLFPVKFISSRNKGGNYTLFLGLVFLERALGVPQAHLSRLQVFSTLTSVQLHFVTQHSYKGVTVMRKWGWLVTSFCCYKYLLIVWMGILPSLISSWPWQRHLLYTTWGWEFSWLGNTSPLTIVL